MRLPLDSALTTTVLLLTYVSSNLPLYLHDRKQGSTSRPAHIWHAIVQTSPPAAPSMLLAVGDYVTEGSHTAVASARSSTVPTKRLGLHLLCRRHASYKAKVPVNPPTATLLPSGFQARLVVVYRLST